MSEYEAIMERLERIERIETIRCKEILTPEEAAMFTGMSADYLYRQKRANRLASFSIGRAVRYAKADLTEWMRRFRIKPQYEIEEEADRYILNKRNARAGKR